MTALAQICASDPECHTMGVFEGVFTKRGDVELSECPAAGAFEEVFVRRGRWRKTPNETHHTHGDVIRLAEHVASGPLSFEHTLPRVTSPELSKIIDPISAVPCASSCAHTAATLLEHSCMVQHTNGHMIFGMDSGAQIVVKNTFINATNFDYDSLQDFIKERKVQSCPARSYNIDDIDDTAFKDGNFALWSSMPRGNPESTAPEAAFKTASSLCESDQIRWDSMPCLKNDLEVSLVDAPCQDTTAVENVGETSFNSLNERLVYESRLRSLRMSGTSIQKTIDQTVFHDQEMQNQLESGLCMGAQRDFILDAAFGQYPTSWFGGMFDSGMTAAESLLVCGTFQHQQQPPPPPVSTSLHQPPPPPPPFGTAPAASPVLRLAEAIAPPALGGPELPSIGSMLHREGGCKPCTFFHTRGCENKSECEFCHLCGPGEKKRRLKALKHTKREETLSALLRAKAKLASYSYTSGGSLDNLDMDMIVE